MILTEKQINELLERLKPLGCTSYNSLAVNNVNIFYKYATVFEYRIGMHGYSLIQSSPASILTDGITNHNNYQLHYFNNNTFNIDIIENIVQKFISVIEKQEKEDKVRKKKKDLEKDFEELN